MTYVRKFSFLVIALIFVASSFLAGAFAPIAALLSANVNTGAANKVLANHNITNLPRESVALDSPMSARVPQMTDGFIALYRIENTGDVEVITRTASASLNVGSRSYDYLGQYEWRFYTDASATVQPADKWVHRHRVQVYQDNFSFEIPESSNYTFDKTGNNENISWIPNVTVPNAPIQFPLPNKFIDKRGNDLLNKDTQNVVRLRELMLVGWEDVTDPRTWTVYDMPTTVTSAITTIAESDSLFQQFIWANTKIRFFGPSMAVNVGTTTFDHNASAYNDNYIYTQNAPVTIGTTTYNNPDRELRRTFTPTASGTNYYAQYELVHNKVGAKSRTSMINVELMRNVNNAQDVRDNIIFSMPPAFRTTAATSTLTFNQDFDFSKQISLPTLNVAPASEIDQDKMTSTEKANYKPIHFNNASSVSAYTFITVVHYGLNSTTPTSPNPFAPNFTTGENIISEKNDYLFRPTLPGIYAFKYHTTTMFGTGFVFEDKTSSNVFNRVVRETINGNSYITYYPHDVFYVTENTVAPEIKWTVPYEYHIVTSADVTTHPAVLAYNATKPTHLIAENDVIALADMAPSTDNIHGIFTQADRVLEHARNNKTLSTRKHFDDIPDLSSYMPGTSINAITQVSSKGKIVIPALIGHNNVGTSQKPHLTYVVSITRLDSDGSRRAPIRFDSERASEANEGADMPYNPNRPLVIDFSSTDVKITTFENGSGTPVTLTRWNDEVSKIQRYQITVTITDNANTVFTGMSGTPNSETYSFDVVLDDRGTSLGLGEIGTNTSTNNFEAPFNETTFNANITMSQTSYYENDVVSFRALDVYNANTHMDDISVEYYIMWGTAPFVLNTNYIVLDKTYINERTVSFELNRNDAKANTLLNAMSGGTLEIKIVAVAKNHFALTNQVNFPSFALMTADATTPQLDTVLTIAEIDRFIRKDNIWSTTNTTGFRLPAGMAISSFNLKLFDITHGASARIGFVNDRVGGALGETLKDAEALVAGDYTSIGASAPTLATLTTFWQTWFGSSTESKAQQNQLQHFPGITVAYPAGSRTLITTVEMTVMTPSGHRAAVSGGTTRTMPVAEGSIATPELVRDRSFLPTEIGVHKLIVRVYNSGGYVSILTADFNVVGTPDTIALPKGGVSTLRIGERGQLPWVEIFIGGMAFKTDPDMKIRTAGAVIGCTGTTCGSGTHNHLDGKVVGTYALDFSSLGGSPIPAAVGNNVIFVAQDTYTVAYELNLRAGDLNTLPVADFDLAGGIQKDYIVTAFHTITVTGLGQDDLGIVFQEKGYLELDNASNLYNAGTTATPNNVSVSEFNLLPQMVHTGTRDITMSLEQLDQGMLWGGEANNNEHDVYNFGRIFLPNMTAQWADELSLMYGEFDIASNSTVKITHSRNPSDPIFDSSKKADKDKAITFNGASKATHYWFSPLGSVSIPKEDRRYVADTETALLARLNANGGAAGKHGFKKVDSLTEATYFWENTSTVPGTGNSQWFTYDSHKYNTKRLQDSTVTPDGIYTVTYTINFKDVESTVEFRIGVGDTAVPIIMLTESAEEALFGDVYKLDSEFRFNTKRDLRIHPNSGNLTIRGDDGYYAPWYVARKMTVSVLFPGGVKNMPLITSAGTANNGENIHFEPFSLNDIVNYHRTITAANGADGMNEWGYATKNGQMIRDGSATRDNREWFFKLTESGDYRITFEIESESGQRAYLTRTITVETPKPSSKISAQVIWGTILIIISSFLLIGVVFYFWQSGRKTKFAGAGKTPTEGGEKSTGGKFKFLDKFKSAPKKNY